MPAVRVIDEHLLSPVLVYTGSGGVFQNELKLVVQDGLVREQTDTELIIKGFTFEEDLTVSLAGGRSFGRYASGTTIPAIGKTPAEIIQMAIAEPIDPTVQLASPTVIQFNQTSINNVLNFSHTINTLGATATSAVLSWRRGNTGDYTSLSEALDPSGTYTHTLIDDPFNASQFNYKYTVTDSSGATSTANVTLSPVPYVQPTVTLNVAGQDVRSYETSLKREKGNTTSTISGNITRNSLNVDLVSYTVQYRVNDAGPWIDIATDQPIGPGSASISAVLHSDPSLSASNRLTYRINVKDTFSASILSNAVSVNFLRLLFYGPAIVEDLDSDKIRSLTTKSFIDSASTFNLNTGSTQRRFIVALPNTSTVAQVLDLDALNANITNSYVLTTLEVSDYAGVNTTYKVYIMTNAIPYTANHRHQVTRS